MSEQVVMPPKWGSARRVVTNKQRDSHTYMAKIKRVAFNVKLFLPYLTIFCTSSSLGVLGTISRMAKTCALRMTPTKLYFILADNATVGGVSIWCELTQVCLKFPSIVNWMFRNQTQFSSIHGSSSIEIQFNWVLLNMSGFFQNIVSMTYPCQIAVLNHLFSQFKSGSKAWRESKVWSILKLFCSEQL